MRYVGRAVLGAALVAAVLMPAPAQAYRVFFGFGGPYFGPPVYYPPPPVYYAPPPVYYPPPVAYEPAPLVGPQGSTRCTAGAYVCPMDVPRPVGQACSCPTNSGRVSGRIG